MNTNKKMLQQLFMYGIMALLLLQSAAAPTPDPGHPAGEVGSGTFADSGNYVFRAGSKIGIGGFTPTSNLTIRRGGLCVTTDSVSCSAAAEGNVEIEDGSLCVGDLGCSPSSTEGQVFAEGACLSSAVLFPCTSPIPDGNMEIEDGSLCVGARGCSSSGTEGNLFVSRNITLNDGVLCAGSSGCSATNLADGQIAADTGLCVGATGSDCSSLSDGFVEIEDGAVCIGNGGCSASFSPGQLLVEGGACIDSTGTYCPASIGWGDVIIADGGVCIGDSGCTPPSTNGLLIIERGACIGSPSTSCSEPISGNLEIEDGSVCIGDGGCNSTLNDGELHVEDNLEIEDGSLCVGDGGCGAPSTDAQVHINSTASVTPSSASAPLLIGPTSSGVRLMLDRDGIFTNTGEDLNLEPGGNLIIGTSISDTNIELEDGSMCIGSGGCTASATDGDLLVEDELTVNEGITATTSSSLGSAVYGSNTLSGAFGYLGLGGIGVSGTAGSGVGALAGSFVGNVEITGDLYVSGTCSGGATCNADIAEFLRSRKAEAADVVEIGRDGILTPSSGPYSAKVAGIISTDPSMIMPGGEDKNDPNAKPLALAGIVPVKVTNENGAIQPGDLLVSSSTPGHAMRCDDRKKCYGAVIGKALEPFNERKGVINTIVMLG